jgi:hypothetical protein
MSWNTGFPGGCPTSSLYDDAMNSPQSQKLAVGSIVERYVADDTSSTATATIQFHLLKVFLSIDCKDNSFAPQEKKYGNY